MHEMEVATLELNGWNQTYSIDRGTTPPIIHGNCTRFMHKRGMTTCDYYIGSVIFYQAGDTPYASKSILSIFSKSIKFGWGKFSFANLPKFPSIQYLLLKEL